MKYTKQQILEAIKHWEKQLKLGNYKETNEATIEGDNRIGKPMRRVHNEGLPVIVAEFKEAAGQLYPGQENAPLNAGVDGEIYGQVNQVLSQNGKCILTLAPYRNGRRSKDLSVGGFTGAPLKLSQAIHLMDNIPETAEVYVRMKDPYGFGPKADVPVEHPVECIDIDSAYGLFLRLEI